MLQATLGALQTCEAETSGRQSVLLSPPEHSTIPRHKVGLESGT